MFIDLVFYCLMLLAVVKGFSRGLIVAVFSLLAFIIGLAAALKLSAVVAGYLENNMQIGGKWLPVLSFALVFLLVVFAVQWGAAIIKKAVSLVLLGWVDKLAGILLYAVVYTLIYSVILFYATQINLISKEAQEASNTYGFIEPFGPKVVEGLGVILPFFKDMFDQLSDFFEGVSKKAA